MPKFKDDKWGEKAFYIIEQGTEIKETDITKHGRTYNSFGYRERFRKDTGIEDIEFGTPKRFFPTRAEAEHYLWRKRMEDEIRGWLTWEGRNKLARLSDDELVTICLLFQKADGKGKVQ